MVDRIHRNTAIVRALAHPTLASGFADGLVLVLDIAHLADRGHTVDEHAPRLAGRQLEQRVIAFFGNQLRLRTRGTRHLRAFAGLQLDVVHRRAWRNIAQRQSISDHDIGLWPADHLRAYLQAAGVQDVPLLAVGIAQQRDACRTVGIVFDRSNGRRDPGFVTLEIYDAQLALV